MSKNETGPKLTADTIHSYLDQLEDSVCLYSLEGIVEYCNPAHEKMFGYSADELIGLAYSELPFLSPEFAKISERLLAKIKE